MTALAIEGRQFQELARALATVAAAWEARRRTPTPLLSTPLACPADRLEPADPLRLFRGFRLRDGPLTTLREPGAPSKGLDSEPVAPGTRPIEGDPMPFQLQSGALASEPGVGGGHRICLTTCLIVVDPCRFAWLFA